MQPVAYQKNPDSWPAFLDAERDRIDCAAEDRGRQGIRKANAERAHVGKEIGASLGISEETVQVHVKNILAKLGARDRTAAIAVAVRRGIIHLR